MTIDLERYHQLLQSKNDAFADGKAVENSWNKTYGEEFEALTEEFKEDSELKLYIYDQDWRSKDKIIVVATSQEEAIKLIKSAKDYYDGCFDIQGLESYFIKNGLIIY